MEEIYQPLNESLRLVGAIMDAAEAHGMLCGLLCSSSKQFEIEEWLKHVLAQTDGLASKCEQQLSLLKNYTQAQLNSPQCEFQPLLPGDDIPLAERTQALGGWCENVLFGLALTGVEIEKLSNDGREFIDDLVSISRVAHPDDSDESEENNYMQIVEYIRIGIINLYDEVVRQEYGQGGIYAGKDAMPLS